MLSPTKCAALAMAVAALCGCAHSTIALSTDWIQNPTENGGVIPTLAEVLDAQEARANRLVERSKRDGLIVEVEAAHASVRAAQYLRRGYSDNLDVAIDKLSGQRQEIVKMLRDYIGDVQNRGFDGPDSADRRMKTLLTGVGFEDYPRVLRTTHTFNAPNANDVIPFEVEGDFPEAGKPSGDAYLSIDGNILKNTTRNLTTLTFSIPKPLVVRKNERVEYIPAQLRIPNRGDVVTLDLDFVALPSGPGRVLFSTLKKVPKRETEVRTTTEFVQDSSTEDKETTHCEPMEPDWAVISDKVEFHMNAEGGKKDHEWFDLGNQSTATAACWRFKTLHRGDAKKRAKNNPSGKVAFTLRYTRYRDVPVDEPTVLEFELAWGESKPIGNVPLGAKTTYIRFDGQVFNFDKGESSSPYMKMLHDPKNVKSVTFHAGP